ncbi:hypothetical protein [Aliiroseovarius crassostreae]|uniref:hypothetical protein n=1 Tax=Aliiroseovarius crassostreae TaxID=154981 RepID=UPI00128EDF09|nr:hypothetical protein [Aliiroseovarius crassostreae]
MGAIHALQCADEAMKIVGSATPARAPARVFSRLRRVKFELACNPPVWLFWACAFSVRAHVSYLQNAIGLRVYLKINEQVIFK